MKFNIKKFNTLKFEVVAVFVLSVILISTKHPIIPDNTQIILSDLITVTGIFSGIITAFIISKVFQLKIERDSIKKTLLNILEN